MTTQRVKLSMIQLDGGTQSRAEINSEVVAEYSNLMEEGVVFAPVKLVFDGQAYWPWDGFHRIAAADLAGFIEVEAEVLQGTQRDAVLLSCGANADHGLRRSNADKRRAAERLLRDAEWGKWSDREIARKCNVSFTLVADVRNILTAINCSDIPPMPRTYTTKHGTTSTMRIPARPGTELSHLERPGTDEGETAPSVMVAPNMPLFGREEAVPRHTPAQRNLSLADPDFKEAPALEDMDPGFAVPYRALSYAIGVLRQKKWATVPQATAARYIAILADQINL